MNDVHYYLKSVPSCPQASFYVSGLQFEQTPGRYLLPCGEGEYSIYTDPSAPEVQKVNMKTNGSGNIYSHGNIGLTFADVVIDMGYLRFFWG